MESDRKKNKIGRSIRRAARHTSETQGGPEKKKMPSGWSGLSLMKDMEKCEVLAAFFASSGKDWSQTS